MCINVQNIHTDANVDIKRCFFRIYFIVNQRWQSFKWFSLAYLGVWMRIIWKNQKRLHYLQTNTIVTIRTVTGDVHTRDTHSYLLLGEEQPQSVGCDSPFTVRHFLLECGGFAQVRNNRFHVENMKQLFQDTHIDSIMTFLRQINLFNKI